jgi:transposase
MNATELSQFEGLKKENAELEKTLTTLQNQHEQIVTTLQNQFEQTVARLEEQIKWYQRQLFGKRSEKIISDDKQLSLFEMESGVEEGSDQKQNVPAHTRCKPNRNGQDAIEFPDDLDVETTVLDLSEDQKVCPKTGKPLVKIGEEVTEKLARRPASFYLKRIIRPKYVVPGNEESGVQTKELPDGIIPRCRVDESFLAHLITLKFVDHLPLYRITQSLKRDRIYISRKLSSQWVVRIGLALRPLRDLMLSKIFISNNVFADESPVRFLEEKSKQGYMWTLVGGVGPNPPYRIYNFRENRRHDNLMQILKDYRGVLHSDKYGAYETLAQKKQIVWCPCWAHIRRKFFEAEAGDPHFREWVLLKIKSLFQIEEEAWLLSDEGRLQIRHEQSIPIIDELIFKVKERLTAGSILPKSKFKEALGYFMGLAPYLKNYTNYPNARLDNNVAERAIRPLAIGRKNWLFFGSADGGEAAATLLSLVQTCLGLGINPEEYLEDLLRNFMGHSAKKLDELLPDQWLLNRQNSHGSSLVASPSTS